MSDRLAAYLGEAARAPWRWGAVDCLMVPADWWHLRNAKDPAAAFRGSYDCERGARALIRAGGGLEAVVAAGLARAGARATEVPSRGDVGIVTVIYFTRGRRAVLGPAGAICIAPKLWAVKHRAGLMAADFALIRAWSFEDMTKHG